MFVENRIYTPHLFARSFQSVYFHTELVLSSVTGYYSNNKTGMEISTIYLCVQTLGDVLDTGCIFCQFMCTY